MWDLLALLTSRTIAVPQGVIRVDDQGGDRIAVRGDAQLGRDAQDTGELDDVLVREVTGHWMVLRVCAAK